MIQRRDALILGLWSIAMACVAAALWIEGGRWFLVPAVIFAYLAASASYRRTR